VLRGSADAQWTVVSLADQLKVSGVKPGVFFVSGPQVGLSLGKTTGVFQAVDA
jgi:hypothetical protein